MDTPPDGGTDEDELTRLPLATPRRRVVRRPLAIDSTEKGNIGPVAEALLDELGGGFLDNHLPAGGAFTTRGRFELVASIPGKETILAVLTEHKLDVSEWEKVYTKELGREFPQYHWYTFGRNGTIRDSLKKLHEQLKRPKTGYWFADFEEISIVK